jgi:GNAT superfamily N-acetyltransferase
VESARRAHDDDLPAIRLLAAQAREELGAAERGGRLFIGRETAPEPVLDLADPGRIVVVGAIDDTAVGYAVGRVEALRDDGLLGIVEELYVEPEARGVAVGEGMMDVLLPWFRERGCVGVDAAALPGARATKNFFERSGFSARLLVMHHRLGGAGGST